MIHHGRESAGKALLRVANRLSVEQQFVSVPADAFHERPSETPLWGWGRPRNARLEAMFEARSDAFLEHLDMIGRYGPNLVTIDGGQRTDLEPCWSNPMFIGLDGTSLYGFLRDRHPRRYVEIGSGYSTKFAARAKRDGGLDTEIVSIDPEPRADIDRICDRLIRAPLEATDQEPLRTLQAGDMVLLDGSHRLLMGNHLALFFLELLPSFPSGVLVGVHDIYLPDDYAPDQVNTYWNEQYLVAATLLAGTARYEVTFPCHYVATSHLREELVRRWDDAGLAGLNGWGCTLWFTVL